MTTNDQPVPKKRWPRSQKFRLSARGTEAESSYREDICAARVVQGRPSFDAAIAAWAERLTLLPSDGLYLGELQLGGRTIAQIVSAVEVCGATATDVHAAIDRLTTAGMIEAIPAPEPPPPPPRPSYRW